MMNLTAARSMAAEPAASRDSVLTRLQYRLLRRLAPGEPTQMSGAAYRNRSKLAVLLGEDLLDRIRGRDVLDYGCGSGAEAVEMAAVARSVYGLDIVPRLLEEAAARARDAGVATRCTFGSVPPAERVDVIVSLDSFEHFPDPDGELERMFALLRPGGSVIASFGPSWYHPYGGHLFSVFPWAHLLFTEAALIRWRSDIRSDGATRFGEVEGGLNQMTIARFERMIRRSRFEVRLFEPVPIRRKKLLGSRLTREFTTSIVRCVLERPLHS
jgi:SAM-dependent methyltransferase